MDFILSENIKELRIQYGLSQVELAKRLGVTKQFVSNWENDNVLPSIEMLVKLADFFRVSTDRILGRSSCNTIDANGLTSEQSAHIRAIVKDIRELNMR